MKILKYKIPIYQPFLSSNELKYLNECIKSNYISSKGNFVKMFENKFAKFIGAKYATSCCNGTCALHLAIATLGIGYGDEIIIPTLTFIATANSIINNGATPVLVDVQNDWQINPDKIRKKITKKTKAIIAVHLYGYPCNIEELTKISKDYNLFLIEDCAQALGCFYKNKHVGTFGDIGTFSFFANKTITTGEGGMLVTNKHSLINKAQYLKSHGKVVSDNYLFKSSGFNFRMTNLSAAVGLAQLERINKILNKKKKVEKKYRELLKNLPVEFNDGKNSDNSWLVTILVENNKIRNSLRRFLMENNIETRPIFYPLHILPMFKSNRSEFQIAERIAGRGVSLPSYPTLKNEEIKFICDKITEFYRITKLK